MGRLIGIDYGQRRIGVAVSDPGGRIATPITTLAATGSTRKDAEHILRWAAKHEATGVVVGLPMNMDGSDSDQTRLARSLADELRSRGPLPVELWDERLSTFQADELMESANVPPARRRGLRDAFAAQVILQSFLDARRT